MKIRLQDLDCNRLALDIPRLPKAVSLTFDHLTDARGLLDIRRHRTDLLEIAIREVLLSIEGLPLGRRARFRTTTPAMVANVTCNATVHEGVSGNLQLSLLNTEGLAMDLGTIRAQSHLRSEALSIRLDKKSGSATSGSFELREGQSTLGGFFAKVGSITTSTFKVDWAPGSTTVQSRNAHARGLSFSKDGVSIAVAGIDLAEGFCVADRKIAASKLVIDSFTLIIEDLGQAIDNRDTGTTGEDDPPGDTPPPDPIAAGRQIRLDRDVLDTINGKIDVDLTLSMTLPVLGMRTATHHFRIPIDGGILNYRELERDLADLEDAFIDITLRGKSLVLERDIPIIPGLAKPLMLWDLSGGDFELAKQHLVRLRTIPNYRMPVTEEPAKKSRLQLNELDFGNIDISLTIDDAKLLSTGEGGVRTSVDQLSVTGSLHYQPDTPSRRTGLAVTATGVSAAVRDFAVAGATVTSADVTIGAIENTSLQFQRLKPRRLEVRLRNIQIRDLEIILPDPPPEEETPPQRTE